MKSIDQMIDHLLKLEGGFVNDPDDPGGATNFGVTIGTLSAYRGRRVSVQEVRDLRVDEAREIYRNNYYIKPRIHELPEPMQASVFDMYVNAGGNAIKILQRTINKATQSFLDAKKNPPFGQIMPVDGAMGEKTIEACKKAYTRLGAHLVDAYAIERRDYYFSIGDRRPASRKYARTRAGGKGGWITRAEEFIINKKYVMTQQQFSARVSKWG